LHDNLHVRFSAVQSVYALDPGRAEAVLKHIADSKRQPWAGEAGMSLGLLEMGLSQLPDDPLIPPTRKERLELAKTRRSR
jgi:hypothetical protein